MKLSALLLTSLSAALLVGCGANPATSNLKSPTSEYTYNATGQGPGVIGKWLTQVGNPQADGTLTWNGVGANFLKDFVSSRPQACLVLGPYLNLVPDARQGVGHINARVIMQLRGVYLSWSESYGTGTSNNRSRFYEWRDDHRS